MTDGTSPLDLSTGAWEPSTTEELARAAQVLAYDLVWAIQELDRVSAVLEHHQLF